MNNCDLKQTTHLQYLLPKACSTTNTYIICFQFHIKKELLGIKLQFWYCACCKKSVIYEYLDKHVSYISVFVTILIFNFFFEITYNYLKVIDFLKNNKISVSFTLLRIATDCEN